MDGRAGGKLSAGWANFQPDARQRRQRLVKFYGRIAPRIWFPDEWPMWRGMLRNTLRLVALIALASPAFAVGRGGWPLLKLGMTPGETIGALGVPLIRSASRGFELWIYDGRAEVLFFRGPVIAWTAPKVSREVAPKPPEVAAPVAPTIVAPAPRTATPRRENGADGYDQLPAYRPRRRL